METFETHTQSVDVESLDPDYDSQESRVTVNF